MPRYFKPASTVDKRNYQVTRRRRNGQLVRDQLPQEGIYTPYEMSCIVTPVPGAWVDLPRRRVGIVFGLRQDLGEPA